jgi:hypothetical protein
MWDTISMFSATIWEDSWSLVTGVTKNSVTGVRSNQTEISLYLTVLLPGHQLTMGRI